MSQKPSISKSKKSSASPQMISVNLSRYVVFFALGYVLASTLLMIVQTQLPMNPQLVTVLSVIVSAYIAVYKFIKHHHRALSRREINYLTVAGIATIWLLSALYLLGLWFLLFDAVSREVLMDMAVDRPLPLLSALVMVMILTVISARIGILIFNRLLAPTKIGV
ncbi:ABZJ_00895 family protein [Psychrobacter sp. DM4]|uniref:ABZJ_00895 family protein n=1 Tax=Psychrobacter sp. DM4 TaxID=3440637 RepID=UPI003F5061CB